MAVPPDPQSTGFPIWEGGVALATLVLSFIMSAITGTWILGKSRNKLTEKIDEARLELERKINDETDVAVHDFGETVAAIRQKMTDMELWNRDTFVTKSTFNVIMQQIRSDTERLEDKIDSRFDRIEAKLDRDQKVVGGK